mmetsp:Transcript_44315/g.102334  ORF Transcript_44315/g.102334 Transcript_44315/m.102334 type:complete len:314 (+) Transcript_44315:81-1022(+)
MAAITALSVLFTALLAAPCAATSDPVALLQGKVSLHEATEWHMAKGKYLIDNSYLQHKGPGVMWRLTKNLSDTIGKQHYAAWGTTVDGIDTGDGWVRVGKYFLPTKIRGLQVITPQEVQQGPPAPRMKLQITYSPTEMKAQDGTWVPCNIISVGSKKGTFNVEVTPKKFASYNLTDVPVDSLKKVHRIREFVPAPTPAPVVIRANAAPAPAHLPAAHHVQIKDEEELEKAMEGWLAMKVKDTNGDIMELKTLKKSPLRTMMKMACDRANLSWHQCQRRILFKRKGAELNENDHPFELGMVDGEAPIEMVEKKR